MLGYLFRLLNISSLVRFMHLKTLILSHMTAYFMFCDSLKNYETTENSSAQHKVLHLVNI